MWNHSFIFHQHNRLELIRKVFYILRDSGSVQRHHHTFNGITIATQPNVRHCSKRTLTAQTKALLSFDEHCTNSVKPSRNHYISFSAAVEPIWYHLLYSNQKYKFIVHIWAKVKSTVSIFKTLWFSIKNKFAMNWNTRLVCFLWLGFDWILFRCIGNKCFRFEN